MCCRGDIDHIHLGPTEEDRRRWGEEDREAVDRLVEEARKQLDAARAAKEDQP